MDPGLLQLHIKGAGIFWLINFICMLVYLICIFTSKVLTLIDTSSFHINDVMKVYEAKHYLIVII